MTHDDYHFYKMVCYLPFCDPIDERVPMLMHSCNIKVITSASLLAHVLRNTLDMISGPLALIIFLSWKSNFMFLLL